VIRRPAGEGQHAPRVERALDRRSVSARSSFSAAAIRSSGIRPGRGSPTCSQQGESGLGIGRLRLTTRIVACRYLSSSESRRPLFPPGFGPSHACDTVNSEGAAGLASPFREVRRALNDPTPQNARPAIFL
jgi:hypothetical protein